MEHEPNQTYTVATLHSAGVTLLTDETDETDPLVRDLKTLDRLRIEKNTGDLDSVFLKVSALEENLRELQQCFRDVVANMSLVAQATADLSRQHAEVLAVLQRLQ